MAIMAGAVIQVAMGMDKGRVGTVIGARSGEHSGDAVLIVFFEDNQLDICVLPEMVRVFSAPEDGEVVWLSDDQMAALFICH